MKNLENYGVLEMDAREVNGINGGLLMEFIAFAGAVIYVYNNADDLFAGMSEGYADAIK